MVMGLKMLQLRRFFQKSFSDYPVMPGVIASEAMAQIGEFYNVKTNIPKITNFLCKN